MQTIRGNEFSVGRAMGNFNPILLIFAIALAINLVCGQDGKGIGEGNFNEDAGDSSEFSSRVERHDVEADAEKHRELEQLRESPPSLVENISEIAKHISKETSTHEEMTMDESLGQERIYNVHLHKPSIPPKRQIGSDAGIIAELDAHSCAQDASAFGHEHEAAVISHELLCEVSKLSQYLAFSQANLQKEISENSQTVLNEEYTELAAEEALVNILENSVLLADGTSQTAPPQTGSSVPVSSIQASVIRLRDVLTRLTVHFEDIIVRTIGEHPELLEQLRQQLLEVEHTLAQLRPDYDNFVKQLTETSRAVYQGILAAGMPAGETPSVPAANPAPTVNGDSTVTAYSSASTFVDPQQPVNTQGSATSTIVNGQTVNPFINARLLRHILKKVAWHVIRNLNVQAGEVSTPEGSQKPVDGTGAPTYPFINEGFYGSILKHIIKHLYTVPATPVAPGADEDTTVDPLINASFLGGIIGHHPLYHHPYIYRPYIHYPIIHQHPHVYTSLVAEQGEANPIINENAFTSVLKHIIKHFDYVPSTTEEDALVEEPIINENFLGSILRHLVHRFHHHPEGESPVAPPPVGPSPPVIRPSVPQNVPSFPSPSGTTYSQSSSSSYTAGAASSSSTLTSGGAPGYPLSPGGTKSQSTSSSYTPGSASSSSTVTGTSSAPSPKPAPYTSPAYPGIPRPLPHIPAPSGTTFSQSSSSSFSAGATSSSSTLTGTSPVVQLIHSNPEPVQPQVPQRGTNYPLPPVPQSGTNYPLPPVPQSGSNYPLPPVPQSGSNYPLPPVPQSGSNYPLPPVQSYSGTTYSQSTSSSYTPQSASSSVTATSAGPQATKSIGSSSSYTPGSASSSSTVTGTSGANSPVLYPQAYYTGPLNPLPPLTSNAGTTYSQSTSSSYTPGSASSSFTGTSSAPAGTNALSGSSSYTPGSASSSKTITGTGPSPQTYSNQGYPNSGLYSSQLRGKPAIIPKPRIPVYPGTYSSSSSSSYTPSSASSSTTTTSASGYPNSHHFFPQSAPVQPKAPLNPNPHSAPPAQTIPYTSNSNTFSSSSSSSYTPGSASSSSTLTGTSPSHIPTIQSAPVNGHRNTLSQLQSNSAHSGTFSTGSSSSYTPSSSSASATRTSVSNVHPGSAPATESKSSSTSHTPQSASSSNTFTGSSSQNIGRTQYDAHSQYLDSHVSASEVVSNSASVVRAPASSTPPYSPTLLAPHSPHKPVTVASINVNGYDTMNVTLVFPQDKVANALGRKTLVPGDIVVISVKSGTILLGRVVDAVTPITFKVSNSQPPFPAYRKEGRLWRLRARDFQDSQCRSQLNKLLEAINSQA